DSTNFLLTRVTNTLGKDYAPIALDENNFYYLSDQRGITNLFKFNSSTGIYTQVTNFDTGIGNYDLNFYDNTMSYVMTKRFKEYIFVDRSFNPNRQIFTQSTRRKELQQARVIRERKRPEENKTMSIKDLLNARLKEAQQTQTDTTHLAPSQPLDSLQNDSLKVDEVPMDTVRNDSTSVAVPPNEN